MKNRTKIIIVLSVLCAGTLALAACNENPHTEHASQGYNVSVRWDSNGGRVETKEDTHIVDDYRYEDVVTGNGVKLYTPDDQIRGEKKKNVEWAGYFLAGWYRERQPRTNEQGEPLDIYGNVCVETPRVDKYGDPVYDAEGEQIVDYLSEAGLAQAYSYSGKWDFEKDRLDKEELGDFEYQEGEYALTLYAAWVPMFKYEIYGKVHEYKCDKCGALYYVTRPDVCTALIDDTSKDDGSKIECRSTAFTDNGEDWRVVATGEEFDPRTSPNTEIAVPTWETEGEDGTVNSYELNYGSFPQPEKSVFALTFNSVYDSEAAAESKTGALDKIRMKGIFDEATATSVGSVTSYYACWDEGVWYRLYKAKDLADVIGKAGIDVSFDIMDDLDFANAEWPKTLSTGSFSGHIRGNGHTISNVKVTQNGSSREGLFGTIGKKAIFENVSFANVTYRFETASRSSGSQYGLFAGNVTEGATFEEVSVQGTFIVGSDVYVPSGQYDSTTGTMRPAPHVYDVGLYTGNFIETGIAFEVSLQCEEKREAEIVNAKTGELKITIS